MDKAKESVKRLMQVLSGNRYTSRQFNIKDASYTVIPLQSHYTKGAEFIKELTKDIKEGEYPGLKCESCYNPKTLDTIRITLS
jgi:hypothetical protein